MKESYKHASFANMLDTPIYSVLLLEDEKATREYLIAIIELHPHLSLFAQAKNCAEAKAALAQGKPDILVADIGLPDGSGIEVIRYARALHSDLEAMIITVLGDEESVIHALEAGATGYLLKEQAFDELGDAILSLMRGETAISPKVARHLIKRFNTPAAKTLEKERLNTAQEQAQENSPLTNREHEVLKLISKGYSYDEIAESLELSTNTIRAHIRNIYRKLAVRSRSEAIFEAAHMGIISFNE